MLRDYMGLIHDSFGNSFYWTMIHDGFCLYYQEFSAKKADTSISNIHFTLASGVFSTLENDFNFDRDDELTQYFNHKTLQPILLETKMTVTNMDFFTRDLTQT